MNEYVKNLQNIEASLSGNYSTSVSLNTEPIEEISIPKETMGSALYSKTMVYDETKELLASYMIPKKVTVKRYILKK